MSTAKLGALVAVLLLLSADAANGRTEYQKHQQVSLVPARVHEQIGFIPIAGIDPQRRQRVRLRYRGDTWIGPWANVTASRRSTTEATKEMIRRARGRYGEVDTGLFADRPLTRRERRHLKVLVDLARDGDVLVVDKGHPACAGLTRAQAVGIASGRITRWSEVTQLPAGHPDEIALRHVVERGMFEPRFGQSRKPSRGRGVPDGGLAEAAQDAAVAGVTSWSRARFSGAVCAVPIDGIAPSDFSVHGLQYPGAYPVTFVVLKKRQYIEHSRAVRAAFAAFLRSPRAAALFRRSGLVMAGDSPSPSPTGPEPHSTSPDPAGPAHDGRGRPITAFRDEGAAQNELTGERLEREVYPQFRRWVFDPGGILHEVTADMEAGQCNVRSGTWTLLGGWRYPENGAGVIARVRLDVGSPADATIDFPHDDPGGAYVDGERYLRDRALPPHC